MKTCPVCGKELVTCFSYYLEGHTLEEEMFHCPDGHYNHYYSYGATSVLVRDEDFAWVCNTPDKEFDEIQGQINKAVQKLKETLSTSEAQTQEG